MTVDELIEQLRQLPGDLPVLVEGYEMGWDRILQLRTNGVVVYRKAQAWDGEYCLAKEFEQAGQPAVLLVGRRGGKLATPGPR